MGKAPSLPLRQERDRKYAGARQFRRQAFFSGVN
jgi:hypothetical protein